MEWIKNNFRQAILIALITVILSTIGSVVVYSITSRDQVLNNAASKEYVDKQDSAINSTLKSHDDKFNRIDTKFDTKADKADIVALRATTENIWNLLVEMATENQIQKAEKK